MNLKTTTRLEQALGFLELLVVRSKDDRHIPYCSLQSVVNTNTEASTYISHITIMVHAAQQSETVDDQHVSLSCFLGSGLCVAHHLFVLYQRKNLAQMILAYDMRSYQQTPVLMLIEERNEYLLIRWP